MPLSQQLDTLFNAPTLGSYIQHAKNHGGVHITIRTTAHSAASEQVWEEGALEVDFPQDEASEAQHGNAACGHLSLQQQQQQEAARAGL
jgi:hypothetical protein